VLPDVDPLVLPEEEDRFWAVEPLSVLPDVEVFGVELLSVLPDVDPLVLPDEGVF